MHASRRQVLVYEGDSPPLATSPSSRGSSGIAQLEQPFVSELNGRSNGMILLDSRTPLSRSASRTSRRASGKPG